MCVQQKINKEGICEVYCDEACKSCNQTRYDCVECAEFYAKDEEGRCVVGSQVLSVFKGIRPFLNVLKLRGHKFLFVALDDLWLYHYHQQEYEGSIREVFKVISFVEEKQWEIVGLHDYLQGLKDGLKEIPKYNVYSNVKYME